MKKGKSRTWLWVLGGAVLVGIIAGAAGGGGSDGGDTVEPVDTGNVTVRW